MRILRARANEISIKQELEDPSVAPTSISISHEYVITINSLNKNYGRFRTSLALSAHYLRKMHDKKWNKENTVNYILELNFEFELCILICGFKQVLNTKKVLKDEGPMCAIA